MAPTDPMPEERGLRKEIRCIPRTEQTCPPAPLLGGTFWNTPRCPAPLKGLNTSPPRRLQGLHGEGATPARLTVRTPHLPTAQRWPAALHSTGLSLDAPLPPTPQVSALTPRCAPLHRSGHFWPSATASCWSPCEPAPSTALPHTGLPSKPALPVPLWPAGPSLTSDSSPRHGCRSLTGPCPPDLHHRLGLPDPRQFRGAEQTQGQTSRRTPSSAHRQPQDPVCLCPCGTQD